MTRWTDVVFPSANLCLFYVSKQDAETCAQTGLDQQTCMLALIIGLKEKEKWSLSAVEQEMLDQYKPSESSCTSWTFLHLLAEQMMRRRRTCLRASCFYFPRCSSDSLSQLKVLIDETAHLIVVLFEFLLPTQLFLLCIMIPDSPSSDPPYSVNEGVILITVFSENTFCLFIWLHSNWTEIYWCHISVCLTPKCCSSWLKS